MTSGVELRIRLSNMVVSRFIFSSILHIWYVVVRISKSISGSPFDFEITRVGYILFSCKANWGQWHQKGPENINYTTTPFFLMLWLRYITKTCLFKHIEDFTSKISKKFSDKSPDIVHISAQNIDCGYSLEPPRRGGSNEYPQFMFFSKIRKIMYTPVNPSFTI